MSTLTRLTKPQVTAVFRVEKSIDKNWWGIRTPPDSEHICRKLGYVQTHGLFAAWSHTPRKELVKLAALSNFIWWYEKGAGWQPRFFSQMSEKAKVALVRAVIIAQEKGTKDLEFGPAQWHDFIEV